jgi:hypothetical protein
MIDMSRRSNEFVKVLAYKGLKMIVDPETGRDGVVAGGPVTDGQLDTLVTLLTRLEALERLADRCAKAPEVRRKLLTMAGQVEAQIVNDTWGPSITRIANVVPDAVLQEKSAGALLDMLTAKAWIDIVEPLRLDTRASVERAYRGVGGDTRTVALLGLLGAQALDYINEKSPTPGLKSFCEKAGRAFANAAGWANITGRVDALAPARRW